MFWLKFILLTVGFFYMTSNVGRLYAKNRITWPNMLFMAASFAGFITLQWLR